MLSQTLPNGVYTMLSKKFCVIKLTTNVPLPINLVKRGLKVNLNY